MGLPQLCATIRWRPSSFLFDGIELGDPSDGLFGDRRALRPVDINELASDIGQCQATARIAQER